MLFLRSDQTSLAYTFHSENLKSDGVSAQYVHLDLTDSKSIASAKDTIEKAEGHLDCLINNAVAGLIGKPQTATDVAAVAVVRETYEVNVFGVMEITTVFLPLILASKSTPSIVNVSSGAGSNTFMATHDLPDFLYQIAYNSSKAALNSYTISLAHELKGKAVVTAINPGFTTTKGNGFKSGGKTPTQAAKVIVPWVLENDTNKTGKYTGSAFKQAIILIALEQANLSAKMANRSLGKCLDRRR